MERKGWFWIVAVLLGSVLAACGRTEYAVKSPDGSVVVEMAVRDGNLCYRVFKDATLVVDRSDMLWSVAGDRLGSRVEKMKIRRKDAKDASFDVLGGHASGRERYNGVLCEIVSDTLPAFLLEVRAFDEGVAFRYLSDAAGAAEIDDFTTFIVPSGTTVWLQDNIRYYEGNYSAHDADDLSEGQLAGPPVVVKYPQPDLYAAVTEAGLADFAGMALRVSGKRVFQAELDGKTLLSGNVRTPWRVVLVGSLNDLVNNDVVAALSENPSETLFRDADRWLKPGKCVWSWLTGTGVSFENMKKFSEWAGQLGIEYNLVDEGWSSWQEDGKDGWALMKELVDYSAERNVKVWAWKAYPDRNGIPGIQTPERRKEFFEKCKETGIAGLKIDFFDSESQEITKYYRETLREAAEYGLMINFHGCDKPTGLNRTYPNEMSREGIRGYEYGISTDCNVTLPFTRLLAGHGDVTPLVLNPGQMNGTTLAHQLASAVIYSSPLLCLAAHPEEILNSPDREFIVSMPTVWDETVVLPPSEIGEAVLWARRSGSVWYVGGMTKERRSFELDLSFLDAGEYAVSCITDIPDQPHDAARKEERLTGSDKLRIEMNARGGFAAKISPL